jgi:hypothetical protein
MTDIAILGQMGGSGALAIGAYQLVHGMAMEKLRVKFLAEFTGPAGSNLKSFLGNRVDVLHRAGSVLADRISDSAGYGRALYVLIFACGIFLLQPCGLYKAIPREFSTGHAALLL